MNLITVSPPVFHPSDECLCLSPAARCDRTFRKLFALLHILKSKPDLWSEDEQVVDRLGCIAVTVSLHIISGKIWILFNLSFSLIAMILNSHLWILSDFVATQNIITGSYCSVIVVYWRQRIIDNATSNRQQLQTILDKDWVVLIFFRKVWKWFN